MKLELYYTDEEFNTVLQALEERGALIADNPGYSLKIIFRKPDDKKPLIYWHSSLGSWNYVNQYYQNPYYSDSDYPRVMIYSKRYGKKIEETVHRLVGYSFNGICHSRKNKEDIDHIDGNTFNNNPSNLRKVSHKVNCNNHHNYTVEDKKQFINDFLNDDELSLDYDIIIQHEE